MQIVEGLSEAFTSTAFLMDRRNVLRYRDNSCRKSSRRPRLECLQNQFQTSRVHQEDFLQRLYVAALNGPFESLVVFKHNPTPGPFHHESLASILLLDHLISVYKAFQGCEGLPSRLKDLADRASCFIISVR